MKIRYHVDPNRCLRIIYVPEKNGPFVITAFELRGKPLVAYRRRRKKKS